MLTSCSLLRADYELKPVAWDALPGWNVQQAQMGLLSLQRACEQPATQALTVFGVAISAQRWNSFCADADTVNAADAASWIMANMHAYKVRAFGETHGLLTGYFTPELPASFVKTARFNVPVYGKPADALLNASRADIDAGALKGKGLEIVWLDDPVAAFFMHVQGSAMILLPDGQRKKLVYAGKNTHAYASIGATFIRDGVVAREEMSLQWLTDWLHTHPDDAARVMQRNPSYIFFAMQDAEPITGAHGSALTAMHSVAVDPLHVSYGIPLWLAPDAPPEHSLPQGWMAMAQDTGSAIKGPLRADLYTGIGEGAKLLAGGLNARYTSYVLVPATVTQP